jgi:hypothetical protein
MAGPFDVAAPSGYCRERRLEVAVRCETTHFKHPGSVGPTLLGAVGPSQLRAVPGQTMNLSRLQVDTVGYFSLKSPNKKSVRAPRLQRRTYHGAC